MQMRKWRFKDWKIGEKIKISIFLSVRIVINDGQVEITMIINYSVLLLFDSLILVNVIT